MRQARRCRSPSASQTPASSGGDIIVTAQRQNQKLRDVPISITALDHDTLIKSGVTSTADLARITPGFNLPQYGFIPSRRFAASARTAPASATPATSRSTSTASTIRPPDRR